MSGAVEAAMHSAWPSGQRTGEAAAFLCLSSRQAVGVTGGEADVRSQRKTGMAVGRGSPAPHCCEAGEAWPPRPPRCAVLSAIREGGGFRRCVIGGCPLEGQHVMERPRLWWPEGLMSSSDPLGACDLRTGQWSPAFLSPEGLTSSGVAQGCVQQSSHWRVAPSEPGLSHMEFVPFFKKTASASCPGAHTGFI